MARIPEVRREDLPADMQKHYDSIAGSRGHVIGPFLALLHSPDLAGRIANAGAYIRFETTLAPAMRELVILTVARTWDCQFEWTAHEPIANEAGTRPEAIAAIREGTAPKGLTPEEELYYTYVRELLTNKRVPQPVYEAAAEALGTQALVDLTATAGYYSLLASVLNAFAVWPAEGTEPLLPNATYD